MVVSIPEAPPTPTPEQLEEGRMFYFAFSCWNCHGVHGHGDGPGSRASRTSGIDPSGPPT